MKTWNLSLKVWKVEKFSPYVLSLFYECEFENIIFYSENTLKIKLKNECDRKWMYLF